jgi:hypothetical protein
MTTGLLHHPRDGLGRCRLAVDHQGLARAQPEFRNTRGSAARDTSCLSDCCLNRLTTVWEVVPVVVELRDGGPGVMVTR